MSEVHEDASQEEWKYEKINRIKNYNIKERLVDNMVKYQLRWFEHVWSKSINSILGEYSGDATARCREMP